MQEFEHDLGAPDCIPISTGMLGCSYRGPRQIGHCERTHNLSGPVRVGRDCVGQRGLWGGKPNNLSSQWVDSISFLAATGSEKSKDSGRCRPSCGLHGT